MKHVRVLSAGQAAELIKDGDTLATGGFVSSAYPETLTKALEKRFLNTGHPKDLTLVFAAGQGHRDGTATDHLCHEGLLKRVVGGHWDRNVGLSALTNSNAIEAYNLPQGVISQLYRDIAAHKLGTLTHVGLYTFIDPRADGGKLNSKAQEDLVKLVNIDGEERLLYKSFPIDVVFLRANYADEYGNCTVQNEIASLDVTAMAQACKNSGGKVIVQVEEIVKAGDLDPRMVAIPGIYVDTLVIGDPEDNHQCYGEEFDGSLCGEYRIPLSAIPKIPLDPKKVIARRAAMEILDDAVVNLGTGVPEKIARVAAEEGISDRICLTVESGLVGGVPAGGQKFGASINALAMIPQNVQFDFYQGGGLDIAFLGLAEVDKKGNVNISKFNNRVAGVGGFMDITQNAKKVIFCGTFNTKGFEAECIDGKLVIKKEGSVKKILDSVEQIAFSGKYANESKQPVKYITERAVFELNEEGLILTEIAPGVDLEKDIISQIDFQLQISPSLKQMDSRIFVDEPMGLDKK